MVSVLVVDDEISLELLYTEILRANGFEFAGFARNGEEAISMYKSLLVKPDIILMDYRMPIKNGIDTSKEILEIDNQSKIIFLSADMSIKDEALSLGIISFIDKPFTIKNLVRHIVEAIDNK